MTLASQEIVQAPAREWQHYPEYKDSGVKWLGEIPAHWEVKRLRYICTLNPSKSESRGLPAGGVVSFVPMEKIGEGGGLSLMETRVLEEVQEGYTYFRNGDVVVAKITPCFENGKGALCHGLIGGVGFGTTELQVLRTLGENHPKFVFYLTMSDAFRRLGTSMMKGSAGQKRVPDEFTLNFKLGRPTPPEQRAIANFLDRETQKIDNLIAKRERLIELLEEKRTALISRAVTKGLDPDVPMKDSGVEWLGEVPDHWEITKLGHVAKVFNGTTPSRLEPRYWTDGTVPWLSSGKVNDYIVTEPSERITEQALQDCALSLVPRGAVIMGLVGQGRTRGMSAFLDFDTCVNQNLAAIVPEPELDGRFLHYALASLYFSIRDYGRGGNQEALNCEIVSSLRVSLPPADEREHIVKLLNDYTGKIDTLIGKMREHIERLREYRTALISAAVTGKIDVREELERVEA